MKSTKKTLKIKFWVLISNLFRWLFIHTNLIKRLNLLFSVPSLFLDIDECASDPCKNGATCLDGIDRFQCQCPGGYRGRDCSIGRKIHFF